MRTFLLATNFVQAPRRRLFGENAVVLSRLVYYSRAAEGLSYADLKDIMEASERNNTPQGITGLLCYGNGWFLQALEGDRNSISETYTRIANDQRHTGAVIADCSEVESRVFGFWSMRLAQIDSNYSDAVRDLATKYSTGMAFSPPRMNAQQALKFMLELNDLQRG